MKRESKHERDAWTSLVEGTPRGASEDAICMGRKKTEDT
jgi:hypothetical protein